MPKEIIDKKGMAAIFSGVGTQESGVHESGVLTKETLIGTKDSVETQSVVRTPESGAHESGIHTPESVESKIDLGILDKAIKQGSDNPRISSWNPVVMAVLRYRNLTTPAYSMSKEISDLLEAAVRRKYPDLYKLIIEETKGKP